MSDRARVSGIREKQQEEKELEREADSWDLKKRNPLKAAASAPTAGEKPKMRRRPGYVPPAQPMDKLRLAREGRV